MVMATSWPCDVGTNTSEKHMCSSSPSCSDNQRYFLLLTLLVVLHFGCLLVSLVWPPRVRLHDEGAETMRTVQSLCPQPVRRSHLRCCCLLLVCFYCVLSSSSSHQEHFAVDQLIYLQEVEGGPAEEIYFQLGLAENELKNWSKLVQEFEEENRIPAGALKSLIQVQLEEYCFPKLVIEEKYEDRTASNDNALNKPVLYTYETVKSFELQARELVAKNKIFDVSEESGVFFSSEKMAHERLDLLSTIKWFHRKAHCVDGACKFPPHIPVSAKMNQPFIIYQSKGVDTGGTIALKVLHKQLEELGYQSTLCDESNTQEKLCKNPHDNAIVITGEWCTGVLEEHGPGPVSFSGRGIQYHLGHHHFSDMCHGHVTTTDSHFLKAVLSSRILSGFFLGCPMVSQVKNLYSTLLLRDVEELGYLSRVRKEDLIVLDMDILHDYPPKNHDVMFNIPRGYRLIKAYKIPRARMPSILLRAKIVLDLALPGPERLAGEGVLLGAVPIISKQWNGASAVDFPGVRKVDSLNNTEISLALQDVAEHYEDHLKSVDTLRFHEYIASLDQRLHHTVDVYMGSSLLRFVVTARSLEEEVAVTIQILAILFVFPLASVDLFVRDVMWFHRHHYLFMSLLKDAGYVRYDKFDPATLSYSRGDHGHSFVKVRMMRDLEGSGEGSLESVSGALQSVVLFLPQKVVPSSPVDLYSAMNRSGVFDLDQDVDRSFHLHCDKCNRHREGGQHCGVLFELRGEPSAAQNDSPPRRMALSCWHVCDLLAWDDGQWGGMAGFVTLTIPFQRIVKMIRDTWGLEEYMDSFCRN